MIPVTKKQNWEIKNGILESLERYPKNSSQLSKEIETGQKTVKKHLQELRDLQQVRKVKAQIRGKEKEVWEKV